MTEADQARWGQREHEKRLADIAAFKAGEITLEEAQRRAKQRRRAAGLSVHQTDRALRAARIARHAH